MTATDKVLEVTRLKVGYSGTRVLHDVSFSIGPGQIVGLVGESGSGKSTLAKALIRLLGPYGSIEGGSIDFQGTDIVSASESELRSIRGARISFIFQNPGASLCPIRKIGPQFYEAITQHGEMEKGKARDKIVELFERLELSRGAELLGRYPFELSGGMNQRVAIALAIVLNPSLVIADEPTSALDVTVQAQVVKELVSLRERFSTSMLFISHNIGLVGFMADVIGVMYCGCIVEYGPAREVLGHPLHPYTKALIAAIPTFDSTELVGLPGRMPGAGEEFDGCAFADRCPQRGESCASFRGEKKGSEQHWALCEAVRGEGDE